MTERLYRSRTDRVFAGVCGGLAERLNVDPSLVRIAWVVLALATAVVPFLVLYVVMALIVPERPGGLVAGPSGAVGGWPGGPVAGPAGTVAGQAGEAGEAGQAGPAGGPGLPPASSPVSRAASGDLAVLLGAGLVLVGLVFLLDRWFWIRVDWDLLWPAALVVIGIVLVVQSLRRPAA